MRVKGEKWEKLLSIVGTFDFSGPFFFSANTNIRIYIAAFKSNGSCSFRAKYEQLGRRVSGKEVLFGNSNEIGNEMNSFSNVRHANFALPYLLGH